MLAGWEVYWSSYDFLMFNIHGKHIVHKHSSCIPKGGLDLSNRVSVSLTHFLYYLRDDHDAVDIFKGISIKRKLSFLMDITKIFSRCPVSDISVGIRQSRKRKYNHFDVNCVISCFKSGEMATFGVTKEPNYVIMITWPFQ